MAELEKGKILIVAGGTGLYPFSDLIDLLYKQ
jgi:tRNA A37 N6-isopentenylltransferase MiaA